MVDDRPQDLADELGGVGGLVGSKKEAERRGEATWLLLRLIADQLGVDWKKNEKYVALKAKWAKEDAGDGGSA